MKMHTKSFIIFYFLSFLVQTFHYIDSLSVNEQLQAESIINLLDETLVQELQLVQREQSKVAEALSTQHLQFTTRHLKIKKMAKLVKIAAITSKTLSLVKTAASIASVIFTFFMPSTLDTIGEMLQLHFDIVNKKLDQIFAKQDFIAEQLENHFDYRVVSSKWNDHAIKTRNAALKLARIRNRMQYAKNYMDNLHYGFEFVQYYERERLDSNFETLYSLAAVNHSLTHQNVFREIIQKYDCDVEKMSLFMISLKATFALGAEQNIAYAIFKGKTTRAQEEIMKFERYLDNVRSYYYRSVMYCTNNTLHYANRQIQKIIFDTTKNRNEIVTSIGQRLFSLYPWYGWSVVDLKDHENVSKFVPWIGTNYFKFGEYLIVYSNATENVNCGVHSSDYTGVISFKDDCHNCDKPHMYVAENMLRREQCQRNIVRPMFYVPQSFFPGEATTKRMNRYVQMPDKEFNRLAASLGDTGDDIDDANDKEFVYIIRRLKKYELETDVIISQTITSPDLNCSGNGYSILRTFCICDTYYEGIHCESYARENTTMSHFITQLAQPTYHSPDLLEIHVHLTSIEEQFEKLKFAMSQEIIAGNKISGYNQVTLDMTEYIANVLSRYLNGTIPFDEFGILIDDLWVKRKIGFVDRIAFFFRKIILGTGGILKYHGEDFFTSYKKNYIQSNPAAACSNEYNEHMEGIKQNILYLNYALSEAFLLHGTWQFNAKNISQSNYQKDTKAVLHRFRKNEHRFYAHWSATSCSLVKIERANITCKSMLTYETMKLHDYNCPDHLTTLESTCKRNNSGQLVWAPIPQCQHQWAEWGEWEECSKSCDAGIKQRFRYCLGTNNISECIQDHPDDEVISLAHCNEQPCCTPENNLYKCLFIGNCINQSQLCDGNKDCRYRDDEDKFNCPKMLVSGDLVLLKNIENPQKWLSCNDYTGDKCGECNMASCPVALHHRGTNNNRKWQNCWGEVFRIENLDEQGGSIRHGTEVGLKIKNLERYWPQCNSVDYFHCSWTRAMWLRCSTVSNTCFLDDCPGYGWQKSKDCTPSIFVIMAPARVGNCHMTTTYGTRCKGDIIETGDIVYLADYLHKFVSHNGTLEYCPHKYLHDPHNCRSTLWQISAEPVNITESTKLSDNYHLVLNRTCAESSTLHVITTLLSDCYQWCNAHDTCYGFMLLYDYDLVQYKCLMKDFYCQGTLKPGPSKLVYRAYLYEFRFYVKV